MNLTRIIKTQAHVYNSKFPKDIYYTSNKHTIQFLDKEDFLQLPQKENNHETAKLNSNCFNNLLPTFIFYLLIK